VYKKLVSTEFLISILVVSGLVLVTTLPLGTVQASTDVTGIITSDTTWIKANSPYTLTGPVAVDNGVTLTIEPGVTVNLGTYYLQVNGTLYARGTSTDSIIFSSQATSDLFQIVFTHLSSSWNEQTGSGCIIENAVINASISISNVSPKINNNFIRDVTASMMNSNVGIAINGGSPVISNNIIIGGVEVGGGGSPVISNNTITGGMGVYGGSPVISNNQISGGSSYFYIGRNFDRDYDVIAIGGECSPVISNNNITGNSAGIGFDLYNGGSNNYFASISGNNIYGCGLGIGFGSIGGGTVSISDNIIYNCGTGILFGNSGLDTLTIERNLIVNNTDGIKIGSLKTTIRANSIANNSVGISIESSPSSTIINNNIQNNTQYSIKLSQGVSNDVNATYNWWGTTDIPTINQTIHDNKNDFNLGTVNFIPFLTAPNPEAPVIPIDIVIPESTPLILLAALTIVTVATILFKRQKRKTVVVKVSSVLTMRR
jgi:hypothetical protein